MSQHLIRDNINSWNTSIFNNVLNNYTVADEKSEILAWLSTLEPQRRHTSEPGGLTRWETGYYKLRNTGIGLVVFVRVTLMVQPYFATEVRGSARPSLGEGGDIR